MDGHGERGARRVTRARVLTVLAALLILAALLTPDDFSHLRPAAFVAIPVEALLGVGAVLALRARSVAASVAGALLGLLTIMKLLDLGFGVVFARPFDPLADWSLFRAAHEFLAESYGQAGATGAVVGVAVLAIALPMLMAVAARRLARVVERRRTASVRTVAVLGVAWVALAVLGVSLVPGVPVAGWNTTAAAYGHATQLRADLADQKAFTRELATDAYRDVPPTQLLDGLRGKDVVFVFIESYGRDAVENPDLAGPVDALLADGGRRLEAAGFSSRSAFLTSSTTGGGSWLAHASLQSGLWIDSQRRHGTFVESDRMTLTSAFGDAGWRTVAVMPANNRDWPEGAVYGFDHVYDSRNIGYEGPGFSFSSPPDQFTLSAFERAERAKADRQPLMAEIDLLSSHAPWDPIPRVVDWVDIGDGSVYGETAGPINSPETVFDREVNRVRTDYRRSIEYSLASLISYVETYGDDDLVLVMLGDHQPSPIVTGDGATDDVPITVIARDPTVFDKISGWAWQDGLNPDPRAPVWRMDTFRDHFFAAFTTTP